MPIRVALNHKTRYEYDRPVTLFPQIVRLRPAPHSRTPISSYSLNVLPKSHFVNWQQDPHGNFLARFVFPEKSREYSLEVDLVAEMTVVNPFDFFLEPSAEEYPFRYESWLAEELKPFLAMLPVERRLGDFLGEVNRTKTRSVDFLVSLNRMLHERIKYLIRMDPGVQQPEDTLALGSGSCRDSAWLLVQILRNLGLAARFVSGYLIQLAADIKPLALAWAVAAADVPEIDSLNILRATFLAMRRAVEALSEAPAEAWIDGNRCPDLRCPTRAIVNGDARVPSISAASILAKTARDALLDALDLAHPVYGFAHNKGYGTHDHLAALNRFGPCAAHRRSFAPVLQPSFDF